MVRSRPTTKALKHGHSCHTVRGHRQAGGSRADDGSRLGQHAALRTRPPTEAVASVADHTRLARLGGVAARYRPPQRGNLPADGTAATQVHRPELGAPGDADRGARRTYVRRPRRAVDRRYSESADRLLSGKAGVAGLSNRL